MNTPEELLDALRRDPDSLGNAFQNPLSFKEEFLLNGLEQDLRVKIHALLDHALAGPFEMELSREQRAQVMESSRWHKVVFRLLTARGSIDHGRDGLN